MPGSPSLFWLLIFIMVLLPGGCREPSPAAGSRDQGPLKVICLGDGLTAGVGVPAESAYPAQLARLLEADGYRAKVVNAGIKGETVQGALERVAWLLQQRFDIFVLATGWEDLYYQTGQAASRKEALDKLVAAITHAAPDQPLYLLLPPALATFAEEQRHYASEMERLVRGCEHCQLLSTPPPPASHRSFWQAEQPYPNEEGHRQIASDIFDLIKTTYE
jgi:hypothetical protein